MDSNGTNILERLPWSMFSSNYLGVYSLAVIIVTMLLIFITVNIGARQRSGTHSIVAKSYKQFQSDSPMIWPDIHQTFIPTSSPTLPVVNLHEMAIEISPANSLEAQSQNTINAKENDQHLSKIVQHLVNTITDYQKQQDSGGCGLENLGHSCYINSALQCLCHIRSFIEIVLSLPEQQQSHLPAITSAYRRLLTKMQSILNGFTSADEVKLCIGELNGRFAGTDEQDSHEFLTVLIEALHDELMDNYQNSSIGDLMHGIIRSTVECLVCGGETNTDDSFLSLPLPIHKSPTASSEFGTIHSLFAKSMAIVGSYIVPNDVTLYDCFGNLLAKEQLGANGQWFCQSCQKPTGATKKLDLYCLPKVLILQLKRFTYNLTNDTKITTKVRVDEVLDLRQFVEQNDIDQPAMYNLVAILAHTGTLASGHYTTFARHLSNCCWYHFNDRHVYEVSLKEALASDVYVLVYERQHLHSS